MDSDLVLRTSPLKLLLRIGSYTVGALAAGFGAYHALSKIDSPFLLWIVTRALAALLTLLFFLYAFRVLAVWKRLFHWRELQFLVHARGLQLKSRGQASYCRSWNELSEFAVTGRNSVMARDKKSPDESVLIEDISGYSAEELVALFHKQRSGDAFS